MSHVRFVALFCAVLLPLSLFAQAKAAAKKSSAGPKSGSSAGSVLPFQHSEKTLPNGLKVIVVPTGFPNIVGLQIPVRTGSRNEVEPGKSGFAHFFEHMMFRGTASYPPDKYNAIISAAGARQNAYTTDDFTNYHITFAKEDLPKILEIEADRFQNLQYSEADFKTEARAVLGEYNKNSANPLQKLSEAQRESAFNTHTYKHTTMGFIKDIEDMPNQYEYSKLFFSRWYRPENATIIVAGDVNADQVFKLVEKYWSSWKRGSFTVDIPQEPPAKGPVYRHVEWPSQTLPWVTVAYHAPAFSDKTNEFASIDAGMDLYFGPTSDIYKKLVQQEQKVDSFGPDVTNNIDPELASVYARVKNSADALYVRDEILRVFEKMRNELVPAQQLADAKSNARYGFVRTLDNTDTIAGTLARFVRYHRDYDTLNNYFVVADTVTPADIQKAARKFITDSNLVVVTLSQKPLAADIASIPALSSFAAASPSAAAASASSLQTIDQKSVLPQVQFKLLFTTGSADDPAGKEGLAALSASMIGNAGSKDLRIDEITKVFFPIAGSFGGQVDKEMTTFTGSVHKDNWKKFADVALPMLTQPGFREDDFKRVKDAQLNALRQDLKQNNEEELGKERLQTNLFAGTAYAHPVLGTEAGIAAITLDDVKSFIASHYTRDGVVLGISGDYPAPYLARIKSDVASLPAGGSVKAMKDNTPFAGQKPQGMNVEIIKKDTRATAISFGLPLPITRSDADFAALNVARTWLGEHRASTGRLYNRIREVRGMNYGDYSYIEFFNRPGGQFFPSPNIGRRSQIFEIWIRPVVPVNAHFAFRIANYELNKLIENGLSQEDFETTRDYLTKNVFLMTATQNQRLGYALDSWWYGIPEYTQHMRSQYAKLTRDDVNRAVKKYLSAKDLSVVIVTKDAEGLRDKLLSEDFSPIKYDGDKPKELLDEDKVIGAWKLNIKPENVKITPIEEVWAK
jgi:zinc protease